jgi:hypothetical protein
MTWKLHGLKTNADFFYLLEALKVEGYWSTKHREALIDNKNLPFMRNIERILKDIGISCTKRFIIKIQPEDQDFKKRDIKVIFKEVEIGFHLERSPFNKNKKIVFMLPYNKTQKTLLKFKNQAKRLKIKDGKENVEINIDKKFKAFGYLRLRFFDIKFIKFIDRNVKNKGSLNIRVNKSFSKMSHKFIMAAFSALIDCEGTLDFYRHFRKIRIRMFNHKYLSDWKKILGNLGIASRHDREGLTIEGWEDFNKLKEFGIKLFHSEKKRKWHKILNSYKRNQISRNKALDFYLNKLKEIEKPITAKEFAKITNKSKRVVNHFLKKLAEKNLIKIEKLKTAWKYRANK